MLKTWQNEIEVYLNYLGENPLLQALVILFIAILVAQVVKRLVVGVIQRFMKSSNIEFDNKLIGSLRRVVFVSIMLLGIASAAVVLKIPEESQPIIFTFIKMVGLLVWTGFFITLSKNILRSMATKPEHFKWLSTQTLPLFENLVFISVIILSIYYLFSLWNIDMTAWLASAGIVGIAVGFAAKDTLANLFSGVFILADAPYKIGDFVVLDTGERGEITRIGIRSTRMLTRDDIEITIPNSVIGNSKIINESGGPYEKSRIRVQVGVAYGSDIDFVRELLMSVAEKEKHVCSYPDPRVRLRMFGPSSLDFELLCWIDQPVLRGRILDTLLCTVYKEFNKTGVEIPYAKQDVYIKEMPKSWQKAE